MSIEWSPTKQAEREWKHVCRACYALAAIGLIWFVAVVLACESIDWWMAR